MGFSPKTQSNSFFTQWNVEVINWFTDDSQTLQTIKHLRISSDSNTGKASVGVTVRAALALT